MLVIESVSEQAQDLVEYALLLGFVALARRRAVISNRNNYRCIWTALNGRYTAAGN